MVEGSVFDVAMDVGTVLEWMEYQEDYRGVSVEKKADHWDVLKETLAKAVGQKEAKVLLFKYRNRDGLDKEDDVPDELPDLPELPEESEDDVPLPEPPRKKR